MIDGITIKYRIENFEYWRRSLNLSLVASVDTFDTGEIRTKKRVDETITTHRGKWETFDLIVKEVLYHTTGKRLFYLTVKGSLHKNYYKGTNYLPFTWQQLQEEITHLCKTLSVNPSQAQISTLEVGVNILTPFEVTPFWRRNVVDYKGDPFVRYHKQNGVCLGKVCDLTHFSIKIYDKGIQNDLPENLMRFELRYSRMQTLNKRGIKFLSDLQDFKKVYSLRSLLLNTWNDVLIFDIITPVNKLPIKQVQRDLLTEGKDAKFWEQLKLTGTGDEIIENGEEQTESEVIGELERIRNEYKYERKKFKELVRKYGNNWGGLVIKLITNEWQTLFKNYPNLPTGKNDLLPILTIKINGKNGEKGFTDLKRVCLSCNKDLHPGQKPNSKYCSSKYVGEAAAHQCRNHNSNPRNNFKKKIEKISSRGLLFDIYPFIVFNNKKQPYAI